MKNIIEVSNLTKQYKGFTLSQASFTVPEGCITGFVGANGAGKTTTLRSILGLARPDEGEIRLFGQTCPLRPGHASDSHRAQLADRIGVVLGAGAFYENLTIRQMKQAIAPAYSCWQEEEFQKLSKRFALDPSRRIKTLSSGTKMKLALALAFSHNAELLIMDEPTGGLDPLVRDSFLTLLREFMEKGGRGVLFSTHITSDLDKCADNIIFIDHGKILLEEDKDVLLDNWRLVKGDPALLTGENRSILRCLRIGDFGFSAVTQQVDKARQFFPEALLDRASIDDIMIALCEGEGGGEPFENRFLPSLKNAGKEAVN